MAAINVNALAIKKGEKSFISKGATTATIPKTNVEQITTEPIKSPKTIQPSPFFAETIEK